MSKALWQMVQKFKGVLPVLNVTKAEYVWLDFNRKWNFQEFGGIVAGLGTTIETLDCYPSLLLVSGAFSDDEIATAIGHRDFKSQTIIGKFTSGHYFSSRLALRRPPLFSVLADDFEDEAKIESHRSWIERSILFPQIVLRGKDAVLPIAERLERTQEEKGPLFQTIDHAWMTALNSISLRADVPADQTPPDYRDVGQWTTWARAFAVA